MSNSKPRIVVIGGSFNPPTLAHSHLYSPLLQSNLFSQIIYLPCGSREDKASLVSFHHRVSMLSKAIGESWGKEVPLVCSLGKPAVIGDASEPILIDIFENCASERMIPTFRVMQRYKANFPAFEFHFVIGTDLLGSLRSWDFWGRGLESVDFVVMPRRNFKLENLPPKHTIVEAELESNSTEARTHVKQFGYDPLYLLENVPRTVLEYMEKHQLYKD